MDHQSDVGRLEKKFQAAKPSMKSQLAFFIFIVLSGDMLFGAYRDKNYLELALWVIVIPYTIYDQSVKSVRLHSLASGIIDFYKNRAEK